MKTPQVRTAGAIADPGERLDQRSGADELCGHVDARDQQRVDGGGDAHRPAAKAIGEHVGDGELARVAHAIGEQVEHRQEREHRGQADDPAVEAEQEHQARVAQEGRRGQVVAGDGDAVEGAGHAAAGGVELGRVARAPGRPPRDGERDGQHHREDRDGESVEVADGGERGGHRALLSFVRTLVKRGSSGSEAATTRRAIRSHSSPLRACR
jgi:hypothetical protein